MGKRRFGKSKKHAFNKGKHVSSGTGTEGKYVKTKKIKVGNYFIKTEHVGISRNICKNFDLHYKKSEITEETSCSSNGNTVILRAVTESYVRGLKSDYGHKIRRVHGSNYRELKIQL